MSYRYTIPEPFLREILPYKSFMLLWAEEQLNPRGELRSDYRNALLCSVISKAIGGADVEIDKFMLKFGDNKKEVFTKKQGSDLFRGLAGIIKKSKE